MTYGAPILLLLDGFPEENPSNTPLTNPQNSFSVLASQRDVLLLFCRDSVEGNHVMGLSRNGAQSGGSTTSLGPPWLLSKDAQAEDKRENGGTREKSINQSHTQVQSQKNLKMDYQTFLKKWPQAALFCVHRVSLPK